MEGNMTFSLIVPIYRNEENIVELLQRLEELNQALKGSFEAVMVIDGSPDRSEALLSELLPKAAFAWQLVSLSRNFGSFSAIRAGLSVGRGDLFGVMAADLQEPAEVILDFHKKLLAGHTDVVVATREAREDPIFSRLLSWLFWSGYRALVLSSMPKGGVDIFACTRDFRDHLLSLNEKRSTLIGLIFWLGFRRSEIPYRRLARQHGRSAWTLIRKVRYFLDSLFTFSTLPVHMLEIIGFIGILFSILIAAIVLYAKLTGSIAVPGYTATVLAVMFFGGINSLGLGIMGEYVFRTLENSRRRPEFIIAQHRINDQKSKLEPTNIDNKDERR
jgi:polyisoprenyl-phosphate glycosyltransferase